MRFPWPKDCSGTADPGDNAACLAWKASGDAAMAQERAAAAEREKNRKTW